MKDLLKTYIIIVTYDGCTYKCVADVIRGEVRYVKQEFFISRVLEKSI